MMKLIFQQQIQVNLKCLKNDCGTSVPSDFNFKKIISIFVLFFRKKYKHPNECIYEDMNVLLKILTRYELFINKKFRY